MLKKLYDKSKLYFALAWIVAYCVLLSVGDSLSSMLGIEKAVTLVIGLALSAVLLVFLWKNDLFKSYGLCRASASAGSMLYYLPVFLMLTANLRHGVALNCGFLETLLYILSMLCVGFLEEIIFRGLLFEAMKKDNVKSAIIVSSITFGIGHIVNLLNGSGAELLPNMLQVVYATAAGFMFVMMYYRSKSLFVCIASHGIFNALSVFSSEASASPRAQTLTAIALTIITGSYAIYLALAFKGKSSKAIE
jgi:membrane protease YdiL (CAAX protease family)